MLDVRVQAKRAKAKRERCERKLYVYMHKEKERREDRQSSMRKRCAKQREHEGKEPNANLKYKRYAEEEM